MVNAVMIALQTALVVALREVGSVLGVVPVAIAGSSCAPDGTDGADGGSGGDVADDPAGCAQALVTKKKAERPTAEREAFARTRRTIVEETRA